MALKYAVMSSLASNNYGSFTGQAPITLSPTLSSYRVNSNVVKTKRNKGYGYKSKRNVITCWKGQHAPTSEVLEKVFSRKQPIPSTPIPEAEAVTRKDFPVDFKFGCSTSAFQTEGVGTEGGRGPSTWDEFIQDENTPGIDIAVDSYHRYKDDVQLLKAMDADAYRFSISWSRILPDGTISGGINKEGIKFYNDFIDQLIAHGIQPFVTLFHFDLPVALQNKYNGFLDRQIVDDFKAYADLCFKTFGDRVKGWSTINEPQVFGQFGYAMGLKDPDSHNPVTDPFLAMHNILLAHAATVKLYKETYQPTQKGEIGISLVTEWFEPSTEARPDVEAAERAFDFLTGWLLEPIVFGDYPFIMKALVRDSLPTFTKEESEMVKGSFDFIGVNYYTSRYVSNVPYDPDADITSTDQFQQTDITIVDKDGVPIGEKAPGSNDVYFYPQGLRDALVYVSKHYNDPKIYITENGYPDKRDDTIPLQTALQDDARIAHILNHLYAISEAMKLGADVKGYFMWCLMDCMEMGSGYSVRYGLNYTDYNQDLKRTAKKSAKWLKTFLANK